MEKRNKIIIYALLIITIIIVIILLYKNNKDNITLSGNNECIKIEKDNVNITLNNANITCNNGPGIYIENNSSVNIILIGDNKVESHESNEYKAAIYSNGELNISGEGSLSIKSYDLKGIKSKKAINISGGNLEIDTKDDSINADNNIEINDSILNINTKDDAIHSDSNVTINNSTINIKNSVEAIEGKYVTINSSNIDIIAENDGLNAVNNDVKNNAKVEINDSLVSIFSSGDGIDSNGVILINGSNIVIESNNTDVERAIDYDDSLIISNTTLIAITANIYEENREVIANQPYLNIDFDRSMSGPFEIGDIKYTPKIDYYRRLIISSNKLKINKDYDLLIEDKKYNIFIDIDTNRISLKG